MASTTWQDGLRRLLHRVDATGESATDGFPHYGDPTTGRWTTSPGGDWTGSFWNGLAGLPPTAPARPATGAGPSSGPRSCARAPTPTPSSGASSSITAPSLAQCSWPIPWRARLPSRGRRVWPLALTRRRASCHSAPRPKKPLTSGAASRASMASRAPRPWSGPRRQAEVLEGISDDNVT